MPRPVCVLCEIEMKVEKNGALAAEMFQGNKIYKIWRADLWKCPICGAEITCGYGNKPQAMHFDTEEVKKLKDEIYVRAFETVGDVHMYGKTGGAK